MNKVSLVVMAAGMGSRYGGLKQIEPIGPSGEIMMDYSIYDAVKAGFNEVIFIIKEELFDTFKEVIGDRIGKKINVKYVFQDMKDIPDFYKIPEDRMKPFGTAHAIYAARNAIDSPFAVINADDFYGAESYKTLHEFLSHIDNQDKTVKEYAMVGYKLKNTLTDHGYVSRGICTVDNGYLTSITERKQVRKFSTEIMYTEDGENWLDVDSSSTVSMNMWGLTQDIFSFIDIKLEAFLKSIEPGDIKKEFLIPVLMNDLMQDQKIRVKVLNTNEAWAGVTYAEDKPIVKEIIRTACEKGKYPMNLIER